MLKLTRETIASAYDYLNTTKPFSTWNLPDSDSIVFTLAAYKKGYGYYQFKNNKHHIWISTFKVTNTTLLLETMSHEMIHLHTHTHDIECKSKGYHNEAFHKYAKDVCRIHGFDIETF